MTSLVERVSKRSLSFAQQRKAYLLRTVQKQSYEKIAEQVVNLNGGCPSWGAVRDLCNSFSVRKGCKPYRYSECGRKPWKLTSDVQKYVLKRLLADRATKLVTSTSLAEDVARDKGVIVEASSIRKFLKSKGYKWLPRSQKRKYSKEQKIVRLRFVKAALRLSQKELRRKMGMSLDGVVLSMPPEDETDRHNYCWGGFYYMWRMDSEGNYEPLAGADKFSKQVPLSRAIPLWGGLSEDGFEPVLWHPKKKTNHAEWSAAVREGKLSGALRKLNPRQKSGPWTILCDNESFLRHKSCLQAYAKKRILVWGVPPKSPDLNPIEMFWGWVRRQLRLMDLKDMRMKRKTLGKTACVQRVKTLFRSAKAQNVAKKYAKKFRSTCQAILKNKGGGARN